MVRGTWGTLVMTAERDNVTVMERRPERSPWFDPRFLAQCLAIIVGLITIAITTHMVSEAKATKLEVVAQLLTSQASEIKNSQTQIAASVQQVTNVAYALQAKVDGMSREIDDLKRSSAEHNAYLVNQGNRITKLEAKVEK